MGVMRLKVICRSLQFKTLHSSESDKRFGYFPERKEFLLAQSPRTWHANWGRSWPARGAEVAAHNQDPAAYRFAPARRSSRALRPPGWAHATMPKTKSVKTPERLPEWGRDQSRGNASTAGVQNTFGTYLCVHYNRPTISVGRPMLLRLQQKLHFHFRLLWRLASRLEWPLVCPLSMLPMQQQQPPRQQQQQRQQLLRLIARWQLRELLVWQL